MKKRKFAISIAVLAGLLLSSQPALADTTDLAASNTTAATTNTTTTTANTSQKADTNAASSSSTSKPSAKPKAKINLKSYLSKKPVTIRAKKNLTLYKDPALKQKSGSMAKKSYSLVSKLSKNADGVPVLKLKKGKYVAAKKSYISVPKLYQNPKKYHQIHYTRVKPYGQVGYTVKRGFEGIKTYLIMKRLGTYNGYNMYNTATWYAVRRFQARKHLKVTGNVNQATWTKLGLNKKLFKQIDSYTAPLAHRPGRDEKLTLKP